MTVPAAGSENRRPAAFPGRVADVAEAADIGRAVDVGGAADVGSAADVGGAADVGSAADVGGAADVGSAADVGGAGDVGKGLDAGQTAHPGAARPGGSAGELALVLRALASAAAEVTSRLVALLRHFRRRWRSSLQMRVVSTTLVVSVAVVSVLGLFLMQQIRENLLLNAERSAQTQAGDGLSGAQAEPGIFSPPSGDTRQLMLTIVDSLEASDENPSAEYGVAVVLPPPYDGPPVYSSGYGINLWPPSLPHSLVVQLSSHRGMSPILESASLPFQQGGQPVPGLLYAAPFGSYFQLYYFFPLTQQQQTLVLLQRTLALVGLALVFLLAGIAWLVTRWVVVPVARAAQGAQLLSTGNLEERLDVRGSDEVAALATSFNDMAASLQQKMRELEDLSQVQRQFVSDVSHELRTPLTTIRMAADLLFEARNQMQTSAARSAELLQSQLGRFESLLADLLEISRYDANAATLDAEPADACDLVRHSADVAQQLAERRGAKIEFRLPNEPCVAEVDRRRVERILRNLLVNAVEHGEGREALVTVAADRDAVAVTVRDFGVGLRPGDEQLVFDRFWRADPARARTIGGTGLGLAIALEDARLHGGWLEAWGEPGRGTVFRLTLPRVAGCELVGSPLPLVPDPVDLDGKAAQPTGSMPTMPEPAGHAATTPREGR